MMLGEIVPEWLETAYIPKAKIEFRRIHHYFVKRLSATIQFVSLQVILSSKLSHVGWQEQPISFPRAVSLPTQQF